MSGSTQPGSVRTHFKTPEGRYKLSHEKSYPAGVLHYGNAKSLCKATLAQLKDKPTPSPLTASSGNTSGNGAGSGGGGGGRFASRLLGGGNGSKGLNFSGGNGHGKSNNHRQSHLSHAGTAVYAPAQGGTSPVGEGEGTYIIFNVADSLYIADYLSQDKDPVKAIHFNSSHPVCHAFDSRAKEGHDLVVGMSTGEVYTASLRQQLQDGGRKLSGSMHYSRDTSNKDSVASTCKAVAWVPNTDGLFVVAYGDGNMYVYDKNKEGGNGDTSFPPVKDPAAFTVTKYKKNPIARWHVCQGGINEIAFSPDGNFLATVGRDGFLRIFDWEKEVLLGGCKSYYGAILCCAWSGDSRYVVFGGEDDLIQVWSMEDNAVVAWGEGHSSWVSSVAFDPYMHQQQHRMDTDLPESAAYRFGSVGQDTQLILWDFNPDEVVLPLRRLHSSTTSAGISPRPHTPLSNSSIFSRQSLSLLSPSTSTPSHLHGSPWQQQGNSLDIRQVSGVLQPSLQRKEVPKLPPVMAHRVHPEYLSTVVFAKDSLAIVCFEGHIKVWLRPDASGNADGSNSGPQPMDISSPIAASTPRLAPNNR